MIEDHIFKSSSFYLNITMSQFKTVRVNREVMEKLIEIKKLIQINGIDNIPYEMYEGIAKFENLSYSAILEIVLQIGLRWIKELYGKLSTTNNKKDSLNASNKSKNEELEK